MALHAKTRTLSELRSELAIRLGFVSVGQSAVMHQPLLTSFLQEAAEQIYAQYGDDLLYLVNDVFPTVAGQRFYAFPDNADPFKITDMLVELAGSYRPINRGIPIHFRTAGDSDPAKRGIPSRWDIGAGEDADDPGRIELYQVPDDVYPIHMSYYPIYAESGWVGDAQPCPIYPSRLCLLMAIGNAKSHFGMSDSQNYFSQFDQLLQKHKASLLYGVRFVRKTDFGSPTYDDSIGGRPQSGGDIIVDLTPPQSITNETGDTILPEQSI